MPNALELTAGDQLYELGRGVIEWLKHDLRITLLFAVLGFLISWIGNAVIVAVVYDGVGKVPAGGPAVGSVNQVTGSVFWALGMAIFFGLFAYRLQVGGPRFWADLRGFPETLPRLLRDNGDAALANVLWGVGGSLIVSTALGSAVSAVFAAGTLVLLGGILRTTVTGLLMVVWRRVVGMIAPNRKTPPAEAAFGVVMLGVAVGFVAAIAVTNPSLRLLAGIAAAVGAFVLGQRKGQPRVALLLGLVGAAALVALSRELAVLAADGGWRENGGDLNAWLNDGGLGVLSTSQVAGVSGGVGSLAGGGVGGQQPPTEEQLYVKYRQAYIKANGSDVGFDDWWQQSGFHHDAGPTTLQAFGQNLANDFLSGNMGDRLVTMFENAPAGFWHGLTGTLQGGAQLLGSLGDYTAKYGPLGPAAFVMDTASNLYEHRDQISADLWNKLDQFNQVMASGDPQAQGKILGELLGQAEFQAVLGKSLEGLMKAPEAPPGTGGWSEVKGWGDLGYKAPDGALLDPAQQALVDGNPAATRALKAGESGINPTSIVNMEDGSAGILKGESQTAGGWGQTGLFGSQADNEVGAYVVSRDLGLDVVPTTAKLTAEDGSVATIQKFSSGEQLPAASYDAIQQQKMAVLDYVTGNADRHAGNWVSTADGNPAAIDNGLSFPDPSAAAPDTNPLNVRIKSDFVANWIDKPLDPEVVKSLQNVDPQQLAANLRQAGVPEANVQQAMARLQEIQTNGQITGQTWMQQTGGNGLVVRSSGGWAFARGKVL